MKLTVLFVLTCASGTLGGSHQGFLFGADAGQCTAKDVAVQALLQSRAHSMGIDCEGMCKKVGAYPNCQCPGFEGEPASSDDTRACIDKYCQDPTSPCPNDAFVGCVKENTKVSALQWNAIMKRMDQGLESLLQTVQMSKAFSSSKACESKAFGMQALLQAKAASWGVDCEGMCKKVGAYPNCDCPGFEGQPASSDDTRACMDKYCQDPSAPCPNDAFVGCVKENTKVSALQWDAVMTKLDRGFGSLLQTIRLAKNQTKH